MRRMVSILAAGSVFLAFGPGEAVAAKKYGTDVQATYDYSRNLISGSVSSSESSCEANRKMTLYHQPGGNAATQQKAGSATTKDDGSYEITATVVPVIGDNWEIVAGEKVLKGGDKGSKYGDELQDLKRKKGKKKKDLCKSGRKRIPA